MDKVGILNVQWTNNYGAVLIAYALQTSIENLGYQAEIIDYRPLPVPSQMSIFAKIKKNFSQGGITNIIHKLKNKLKKIDKHSVNYSSEEKTRRFDSFRSNYLRRTQTYNSITPDDLSYDAYIVGSDVIWKPERVKNAESDVYFLNFTEGKKCKRIAYAASIGTDDSFLLEEIKPRFSELIKKFDAVSIREKASIDYVQELYGKEVSWCIDPTLFLTAKDYDKLFENKTEPSYKGEYIYVYLFENNDEAFDLINRYSRITKLPVICQCGAPHKIENLLEYSQDDGPAEFVERIKNAKLVITDSFHGTVFSIIYKKDFYTISRGKISIRMQDILTNLSLENRYVARPDSMDIKLEHIDYSFIDEIIDGWRNNSLKFLENNLKKNVIKVIIQ